MNKLCILILVVTSFLGCSSNHFIIEGRYNADKGKKLNSILLEFTLQNEKKDILNIPVKLKDDGRFKIKIHEKGQFVGYFRLLSFPRDKWSDPFISNLNEYYKIDTI